MEILRTLESLRTPFWDTIFGLITRLGEETILIVVFCAIYWCISKKMGYVIGISFFMSSLVIQGMKIVFRVPRPWVYDPTFQPVGGAVREATGYAFPSGHTQNAAALLGALGIQLKSWVVRIVLFSLAILVAFSRMYLGVHYLSDVLVSLVITFIIVYFAARVITEEVVSVKRELTIALFIAGVALVVIIIATALYHGSDIETHQLRDGTRAAGAAIGFAIGMFVERVYIKFSVKAKNIGVHVLKFVLGVAGTLAIQEGVRLIGTGLIIDAIRYFLMVVWITIFFPLVIKRFLQSE